MGQQACVLSLPVSEILQHQEGWPLPLREQRVPQRFYGLDRQRDGTLSLQTHAMGHGVLACCIVQERLFRSSAPSRFGLPVQHRVVSASPRHGSHSPWRPRSASHGYARGDVTTNTAEGVFGIFKRGMRGVYQHCKEKNLHRYVAEYDFRYNTRGMSDEERCLLAINGGEGKRLT